MKRLIKITTASLLIIILSSLLAIIILPAAVRALPGEIRGRLPSQILRAVTTPLPTALPAPAVTPAAINALLSPPSPKAVATRSTPQSTEPAPQPNDHAPLPTPGSPPPTATNPLPTAAPSLPDHVLLSGLQIVPQKLNNCGPATLSINLNYYGLQTTQFDVAGVVKPHYDDRNVSPQELVDYTNELTPLQARLFRGGDLDLLKRLIVAGFPVVIEKGYEPDNWQGWMGHYLTLYGYDQSAEQFMAMDTFLGPWDNSGRAVSYAVIEEGWHPFNNTFYVVYEAQQEEDLLQITGPALNDAPAMWTAALQRAQVRINEDPQDAFAWFNAGSSLTHLAQLQGDQALLDQAAAAFDQARLAGLPPRMLWYQFETYQAYLAAGRVEEVLTLTAAVLESEGGRDVEETYLYRGLARQAQGDTAAAKLDFKRALDLRPQFQAALDALDSLP